MRTNRFTRNTLSHALLAALALVGSDAFAAKISRLTPPSELFASNNANGPVISRFMQGQRFDLQATVQPDASLTITDFYFSVDGHGTNSPSLDPSTYQLSYPLANRIGRVDESASDASCIDAASGMTTGKSGCKLVAGLPGNTVVVSQRAYANYDAGVHTLKIVATQSDGSKITAEGNFEVVAPASGYTHAKNVIIFLGDGMGATHRTAARIMAKGYAQGKAKAPLTMDTSRTRAW